MKLIVILILMYNISKVLGGAKQLKTELLSITDALNRGQKETEIERNKIIKLAEDLEKINPYRGKSVPLSLLYGRWKLNYCSRKIVMGKGSFFRKVLESTQAIDTNKLYLENIEVVKYFGFLTVKSTMCTTLAPLGPSRLEVRMHKVRHLTILFTVCLIIHYI